MPPTYDSVEDGLKRSRIIRVELQRISEQARQRYAILAHQDAIGLTILLGSVAVVVGCVLAYAYDVLPAWSVVVVIALALSLLHELEHDLIHRLYFRDRPWLYNAAMVCVWMLRPNTINPWVRRDWHLHHHRVSGTDGDIEERGLTNGERWGVRRFLMTLDPLLALLLRPFTIRDMLLAYARDQNLDARGRIGTIIRNVLAYFPFGPIFIGIWWMWCAVHGAELCHRLLGIPWSPSHFTVSVMPTVDFLAVTVLAPNTLRAACLYFVSSNIHYFGDIEPRNIVQQTQVWTSPWLFPVQMFCFNFGSTHAIHHFAVQYPFYLRQLIARDAHRVMRANGVRFNDFANMLRANRWHSATTARATKVGLADETVWSHAANDA